MDFKLNVALAFLAAAFLCMIALVMNDCATHTEIEKQYPTQYEKLKTEVLAKQKAIEEVCYFSQDGAADIILESHHMTDENLIILDMIGHVHCPEGEAKVLETSRAQSHKYGYFILFCFIAAMCLGMLDVMIFFFKGTYDFANDLYSWLRTKYKNLTKQK